MSTVSGHGFWPLRRSLNLPSHVLSHVCKSQADTRNVGSGPAKFARKVFRPWETLLPVDFLESMC